MAAPELIMRLTHTAPYVIEGPAAAVIYQQIQQAMCLMFKGLKGY